MSAPKNIQLRSGRNALSYNYGLAADCGFVSRRGDGRHIYLDKNAPARVQFRKRYTLRVRFFGGKSHKRLNCVQRAQGTTRKDHCESKLVTQKKFTDIALAERNLIRYLSPLPCKK
jgi:hypothetical protein